MAEEVDLDNKFCSICHLSNDWRVLQCGHPYCSECCVILHGLNDDTMLCPWDLKEDSTEPSRLPEPQNFRGTILDTDVEGDVYIDFQRLLQEVIENREKTIKQTRRVASILENPEIKSSISKLTGTVAEIADSVLAIVDLHLSSAGIGTVVGVPLAVTGTPIGISEKARTGQIGVIEANAKRNGINEVNEGLRLDRIRATQLQVIYARATKDRNFAQRWNINSSHLINAERSLHEIVHMGFKAAVGVPMAFAAGLGTTGSGVHAAGIEFASALIPRSLYQMILSSIWANKNEPSKIIRDVSSTADNLEKQLRIFLIEKGYFKLIYTSDDHWAFIVIKAWKLDEFEKSKDGYTLIQLLEYGDIIESGKCKVPKSMQQRIQKEWYSHFKEYKFQMQDADSEEYMEKETMVIDQNEAACLKTLNVKLEVQPNSVDDKEVELGIKTIGPSKAPPIPCDFGEVILSDIVKIEPTWMQFKKKAVLVIKHSVSKLPKLSSVAIKCYDDENKEWVKLPRFEDETMSAMEVAAEISRASLYVVFMSLDSDTYTVPISGSSFSPFHGRNGVELIFDERTFGDYEAMLEFKMNVYSEEAVDELSYSEMKPILFLHMKEKNNKEPMKPFTLRIPINGELHSDEKVFVVCENSDGVRHLTEFWSYGDVKYLAVRLIKISLLSIIQAKVGIWIDRTVIKRARSLAGPRYRVNFIIYSNDLNFTERTFYVGCCEKHKVEQMSKRMEKRGYKVINSSKAELLSNTTMSCTFTGRYRLINEPVELKFVNNACNYTDKFQIEETSVSNKYSEFIITKEGEDTPLKRIPIQIKKRST